MNKKNRTGCRISALLMAVALTCGASMGALAEEETEPQTSAEAAAAAQGTKDLDLNQKGSIFVALVDEEGKAMTGGSLGLYQVAEVCLDDWNMVYTCTEAFADWFAENEDVELNQETLDNPKVADALAKWAAEQGVATVREAQVQNGEVSFSDLPLGLYLVVQTESAEGFYDIDPFFVTLPHMEDGVWVYGVDASPKVEVNLEPTPQTDTEPHTESSESETQPETKESEKTAAPGTTTTPGGTSGTGTTGGSTTSEKLPQTGQLNWPIPFLAGGGLLLILVGGVLMLSDRRKKNNAA